MFNGLINYSCRVKNLRDVTLAVTVSQIIATCAILCKAFWRIPFCGIFLCTVLPVLAFRNVRFDVQFKPKIACFTVKMSSASTWLRPLTPTGGSAPWTPAGGKAPRLP